MTALVRRDLQPLIARADNAHAGLLIQRGLAVAPENGANGGDADGNTPKSRHIKRICEIRASDLYGAAYRRWVAATRDGTRFRHQELQIQGRLLIGLSGGASLETACAVSHTYGVPYIPGSSIKGVARAFAAMALSDDRDLVDTLFGAGPSETDPTGFGGLVTFHDAWWVPDSAPGSDENRNRPFVQDVVTSHHSAYYGSEGDTPATDLDSPIPNALIGVHGSFRFTFEGDAASTELALAIVEKALQVNGVGAKTRSGYGYFARDKKTEDEREAANKAQRKAEETARQEVKRAQAREAMSPLQREVEEYLHSHKITKDDEAIFALIKALESNHWQGQTKRDVAQIVKGMMEKAGKWKPGAVKKNNKDSDRTMKVAGWLESEG